MKFVQQQSISELYLNWIKKVIYLYSIDTYSVVGKEP